MEKSDEVVERQKLVSNDAELDEDNMIQLHPADILNAPKSQPIEVLSTSTTKRSPIVKSLSSGETTRSQNSASCSIDPTVSDKGPHLTKVCYINERKPKGNEDYRYDMRSRPRKLLKDNKDLNNLSSSNDNFDDRPIKHHSFVSEVPDVKYMEQALLGLLDDFHTGKFRAFGTGCTMDQMKNIREQQESLAKLHFDLSANGDDEFQDYVNQNNDTKAQENMMQLVQKLEDLSVSIEQLQLSHKGQFKF